MPETVTVGKSKASPAWLRKFFENQLDGLVRKGLHREAFTRAVADGLNMYQFTRALEHGLDVARFSRLLEQERPVDRINKALTIANDDVDEIPDGEREFGKAQFGHDVYDYLDNIVLTPACS